MVEHHPIPVSVVYDVFHLLVIIGLVGVRRRGVTGPSRPGRIGMDRTIVGTGLLLVGELASIQIRHANDEDASAGIVGALFALATVVSAVGFLDAGAATLRAGRWHDWRRWTLLATGVWVVALAGIAMTKALPSGVALYGIGLLAIGVAVYAEPTPSVVDAQLVAA